MENNMVDYGKKSFFTDYLANWKGLKRYLR